jgi:hypothetical protein
MAPCRSWMTGFLTHDWLVRASNERSERLSKRIKLAARRVTQCAYLPRPCTTTIGSTRPTAAGQPDATYRAAFKVQRPFARVRLTGTFGQTGRSRRRDNGHSAMTARTNRTGAIDKRCAMPALSRMHERAGEPAGRHRTSLDGGNLIKVLKAEHRAQAQLL